MPENVERQVNTRFTIEDDATPGLGRIAQSMEATRGVFGGLASMVTPFTTALTGLASGATLMGIAKLGSEFENTQTSIAGFLSALGVASDFNAGLEAAASTMDAITIAAAKLPGEAEEYVTVFKASLPQVQGAIGGTLKDMYTFTNQLTAIGKTFGIDAAQIGRDASMMLRAGKGAAGMDSRTFTSILPFMQSLEGHANLTADAFNKMTAPERAKLLQDTFAKLGPMVEHSATSFDAMWGGFQANAKLLMRVGTTPLFEGMKNILGQVNGLLMTEDGQLTVIGDRIANIGKAISTGIVAGMEKAANWATIIADKLAPVADNLSGLAGVISNDGGTTAMGAAGGAAAAMGMGGPAMAAFALLGAGIADFLTRTEAVNECLDILAQIIDSATAPLGMFAYFIQSAGGLIGDVLEGALGGFLSMISAIIDPLGMFLGGVLGVTSFLIDSLRPAFMGLWTAVGGLFDAIGTFLNPVITILGGILVGLYQVIASMLTPVIEGVVGALKGLIDAIAWVLSKLGKSLEGVAANFKFGNDAPGSGGSNFFADMMKKFDSAKGGPKPGEAASGAASAGGAAAARGGGGRAVQDFRFSKFEISQKFAEGFDPDRIATAFASDLAKVGEQKLQSGLEPSYAMR